MSGIRFVRNALLIFLQARGQLSILMTDPDGALLRTLSLCWCRRGTYRLPLADLAFVDSLESKLR